MAINLKLRCEPTVSLFRPNQLLFERLAHSLISRGGNFRIKSLSAFNNPINGAEWEITLPQMNMKRLKSKLTELTGFMRNDYAQPDKRTYEAFDSLALLPLRLFNSTELDPTKLCVAGFQMTVSASHSLKGNGLENALNHAKQVSGIGSLSMIIVIVTDNRDLATPQKIVKANGDQYVRSHFALDAPQFALYVDVGSRRQM